MAAVTATAHNRLRIGIYSPALPSSGMHNGIVTYTRVISGALEELGHSVIIVTPTEIESDGCTRPVHRSNGLLRRIKKFRETRHVANGADPWVTLQVVEAFEAAKQAGAQIFEIEESFGWAGLLAGRGIPVVERLHGPHCLVRDELESEQLQKAGDLREAAELKSFRAVDAITAPTERMLDELGSRYGLKPAVAEAIPNPIATAPPSAAWRLERADREQILFVGRIDRCKGADVVLLAFKRALERHASLKLVMVGPDTGFAQPSGKIAHFRNLTASHLSPQQRRQVRFLGVQSSDRINELRRESFLTVVASRFENFPYSIAEAMSVGMPIITTDTFGGGEMIRDGVDGLVVPVNDVEGMARAIIAMVDDPQRAEGFGGAAQRRASQWLSPDHVARRTVDLYRRVIVRSQAVA